MNGNQMCFGFLVGVFEKNARLLQWLVFFRQFNAIGPLFVHYVHFCAFTIST